MSSEFLAGSGAGVAAHHYGNPLSEQRALAAGSAIVDLSHRSVLTISGPDRLSWINSLTSQSVARLTPGESSETLLLDGNGRIEYAVRLIDDGVALWLLLEREEADGLLAWLNSMRFMLRVELADRSADFATVGTLGQPALPVAAPHGVPLVWYDPWMSVTRGGHQYAVAERHPAAGWTYSELLLPRAELAGLAASAIPLAGLLALEALRIAVWRPRFATEVDEKTIPHELDWLRTAVHLSKGCYRGQETVAKVHNLGHPPRRLVMLYLDGSDTVLPSRGDDVVLGEKTVGHVTSAARHYQLGPVALAVIKRGTDPTAELLVRTRGLDMPATQDVIVPPNAGGSAAVPRLPRLGVATVHII
jgi:folate-binding protein YgfZ